MGCLFCGATDGPPVFREGRYVARGCARCGVVYTVPSPPLEDTHERLQDQHDESFYAAPAGYRARWLRSVIPIGRLLEIGCGSGAQLDAFAAEGFTVEGIEALPDRAEQVRWPVHIDFFERLPPEPIFDCVYHTDLLSHFIDPVAALTRMTGWLRPGGAIAFEVGSLGAEPARWNDNVGLGVHRWFYTDAGLARLLAAAGLEVVARRDFDLTWYVRYLRLVRRLRRGARGGGEGGSTRQRSVSIPRRVSHRVAGWLRYPMGRLWAGQATRTVLMVARPIR